MRGPALTANPSLAKPEFYRAHRPVDLDLAGSTVTNSSVPQGTVGQPRRTIVTWLILPVVICLSQRLSHACLSISNYTAKLRMAH